MRPWIAAVANARTSGRSKFAGVGGAHRGRQPVARDGEGAARVAEQMAPTAEPHGCPAQAFAISDRPGPSDHHDGRPAGHRTGQRDRRVVREPHRARAQCRQHTVEVVVPTGEADAHGVERRIGSQTGRGERAPDGGGDRIGGDRRAGRLVDVRGGTGDAAADQPAVFAHDHRQRRGLPAVDAGNVRLHGCAVSAAAYASAARSRAVRSAMRATSPIASR
jgi:hypothetical protein